MYGQSPMMDVLADMKRLHQLRIDDPEAYASAVSAFVTKRLIVQGIIEPSDSPEHGSSSPHG